MKIKVQCDGCDEVAEARVIQQRKPGGAHEVLPPKGWADISITESMPDADLASAPVTGPSRNAHVTLCGHCLRSFWRDADPRKWPRPEKSDPVA